MNIAIVILNWNGRQLLETFLPSVIKYAQKADVYVADNASTDTSVQYVKSTFPSVRIIELPENGGYARGYNEALKRVEANIYCLLNSDIEVTPDWLAPVETLFENPEIVAVQPKVLDYKNRKVFEYAGAAGGYIDKYGFPFCRGRIFDAIEEDKNQYDSTVPIFWASGCCLFVRSEIFHSLGGFDTDFFAHQEEIDFCWRVHHLKKHIVFCPESVVYHVGGASLPANNPMKIYLNFRNGLFMLLKNLPEKQLYFTLFIRMLLDGIAGIRFLFQGKILFTMAIIRAHFSFYRNFVKFKNKRKETTFDYFQTKSIVWEYFIKNKKYFSSLNKKK